MSFLILDVVEETKASEPTLIKRMDRLTAWVVFLEPGVEKYPR